MLRPAIEPDRLGNRAGSVHLAVATMPGPSRRSRSSASAAREPCPHPRSVLSPTRRQRSADEFSLAYAAAQEGYRLAIDVGYGTGGHLANIATVEAVWGRDDDARAHAGEALTIGRLSGSSLLASGAELTLGFVELTAGRSEEAVDRLLDLTTPGRPGTHPTIALAAIPDRVEAATRVGRTAEVQRALATFAAWVEQAPTEAGRSLLARCRALVEPLAAEAAFGEALARSAALPPFQRARTELLVGEWLRRQRRRQDARPHLRAAADAFRGLGALPWTQRAEPELRASGESARVRDPSTLDQLTPQELQIAALVADGLTNREIAAQLFLSPRTIDYHLRKIFSKLAIASRTELVRLGLQRRNAPAGDESRREPPTSP